LPSETHFYLKCSFRLKIVLSYHEAAHSQFGALQVINEDRVAPKTGFGTHAHREFEIFSYVVDGELEQ
jgi:redox-sensitive bicupin YhaK (pirin superfamily)